MIQFSDTINKIKLFRDVKMASSSDEFYDAESDTLENNETNRDLEKQTESTSPKRPTTLAVNESR